MKFKESIISKILNSAIEIVKSESSYDLPEELILICYDYHSLKTLINLGQLKKEDEDLKYRQLVLRLLQSLNNSP